MLLPVSKRETSMYFEAGFGESVECEGLNELLQKIEETLPIVISQEAINALKYFKYYYMLLVEPLFISNACEEAEKDFNYCMFAEENNEHCIPHTICRHLPIPVVFTDTTSLAAIAQMKLEQEQLLVRDLTRKLKQSEEDLERVSMLEETGRRALIRSRMDLSVANVALTAV